MIKITKVHSIQWPDQQTWNATSDNNHNIFVECAGKSFVQLEQQKQQKHHHPSAAGDDATGKITDRDESKVTTETEVTKTTKTELSFGDETASYNLLELSVDELEELNYYEVLGGLPLHATLDQVKKAYHKACLLYHPDKRAAGGNQEQQDGDKKKEGEEEEEEEEEDAVFLKVKAAFDTLGNTNKRRAYDSSLPFDESIPKGNESSSVFYQVYGDCFRRNLRFDANLLAAQENNNNNKRRKQQSTSVTAPPTLGDESTPLDQVHQFYDYWVRFTSWRDFSIEAAKLTENDTVDLEMESRFYKRHVQKEIDKKAKQLKRIEVQRITTLVERAMAADPRLQKQRQQEAEAKRRQAEERRQQLQQEEERAKQEAEAQRLEKIRQEQAEKQERAKQKAEKEAQKKVWRKARQGFRRTMLGHYNNKSQALFQKQWPTLEALNDDIEFLCQNVSTPSELEELTNAFTTTGTTENDALTLVQEKCLSLKTARLQHQEATEKRRQLARQQVKQEEEKKATSNRISKRTWTQQELSALAKGIKKYPPGGANRWETIAQFCNSSCKPTVPISKDECIETYNAMATNKGSNNNNNKKKNATAAAATTTPGWTTEQVMQLQSALAKYPASMDKNERWTSIAKEVTGKTKKECVQQFKAIREALKNKK